MRVKQLVISRDFQIISDEAAARIARVLGDHSAMAMAIADRDQRRTNGENAVILMNGPRLLVGPNPSAHGQSEDGK